ncbi:MAG: AraC family transcriptional regulator [Spirochaetales bacterium]|nr:AraC family transcriptional regulator [Spirochaetales bacterium]
MHDVHYTRYITFSDDDEKWQIYCTDVGSNKIGPNINYPPHKDHHPKKFNSVATGRILNEYQIVYITNGKGTFISNNEKYNVAAGSIFFLFPNIKHSYKPKPDTGWTEYWIGFQGAYVDKLVEEKILQPDNPIYHIGFHSSLLSIFNSIFEEVNEQKPLYQYRAGAQIMMLLAQTLSYAKIEKQHSRSHEIVEKTKHIFNSNIDQFIDIETVAYEIGISTTYLSEIFKSYTGMTPYQYFINIKINKAKKLLENDSDSIKEISFRLGFEDQYYFSRLFKKKTGVPPSKWISQRPRSKAPIYDVCL